VARELPRHRNGNVPGGRSRFPDYNVLDEVRHWDDKTREVVLRRGESVPPFQFFTGDERRVLQPFVDVVMAQDDEPRIPVLNFIDEKLATGGRDGYRYFNLPDDDELWRLVARGLAAAGFDELTPEARKQFVDDFSQAKLHGEPWSQVNVAFTWEIVHRDILAAFYSHPWAWNEIGFGGPAYPRGYSRFGSPHLPQSEREPWEGREAISWDPGELREGLD
jgi:gluconate 2-dehydrogenase subunit 3-like protein